MQAERRSSRKQDRDEVMTVRFISGQKERLEDSAKLIGKSQADFIRDAVMNQVVKIEEEIRFAKEEKRKLGAKAFVTHNAHSSRGLGIDLKYFKVQDANGVAPVSSQSVSLPPTVIVQAAPAPSPVPPHEYMIEKCAKYIVGKGVNDGPFEKERRMRYVVEMLKETAKDSEELQILAKALDEKIGQVEYTQKPKASSWLSRNGK